MLEGMRAGGNPNSCGTCLHLRSFWSEIFKLISKVTGIFVKPNIEQAVLSINMKDFQISVRSVATHILLAAHSAIMCRWKTNEIPGREITTKITIIAEYKKKSCIEGWEHF